MLLRVISIIMTEGAGHNNACFETTAPDVLHLESSSIEIIVCQRHKFYQDFMRRLLPLMVVAKPTPTLTLLDRSGDSNKSALLDLESVAEGTAVTALQDATRDQHVDECVALDVLAARDHPL